MAFGYTKTRFDSITNLKDAKGTSTFHLEWSYYGTGISGFDLLELDLYRYIETTVGSNADGGPLRNPALEYNAFYVQPLPNFVHIKNWTDPNPLTTRQIYQYIDPLTPPSILATIVPYFKNVRSYDDVINQDTDLSGHGFTKSNGIWVDSAGNDVIKEIFETKRKIYYKIRPKSNRMVFRALPFICLAHTNGEVECKSAFTQVLDNVRYEEGETMWWRKFSSRARRVAVDPVFDLPNNRSFNVWVGFQNGSVVCLDSRTGKAKTSLISVVVSGESATKVNGIRINPENGDAFVVTESKKLYLVTLTGSVFSLGTTTANNSPYGNSGLALNVENGRYTAYSVANHKRVVKWPIFSVGNTDRSSASYVGTAFGKDLVGDVENSISENYRNVFGVCNGNDHGIWANAHESIYAQWTEQIEIPGEEECDWLIPFCIFERPNEGCPSCGGARHDGCGSWRRSRSNPRHWGCSTGPSTYINVNQSQYILVDVGYVYGLGSSNYNVNQTDKPSYRASTDLVTPFARDRMSPFTRNVGSVRTGTSTKDINNKYRGVAINTNLAQRTPAPEPTLGQYGMACDIPSFCQFNKVLEAADSRDGVINAASPAASAARFYNIWATNYPENLVIAIPYGRDPDNLNNEQSKLLLPSIIAAAETNQPPTNSFSTIASSFSISNPVHVAVDGENCIWVIRNTNFITKIHQLSAGTIALGEGNPSLGNNIYGWGSPPQLIATNAGQPNITNPGYTVTNLQVGNYLLGGRGNDPFVDFVLTRDLNAVTLSTVYVPLTSYDSLGHVENRGRRIAAPTTDNTKLSGVDNDRIISMAREWCVANISNFYYGTSYYPLFTQFLGTTAIRTRGAAGSTAGDLQEYNSDNTGLNQLFTQQFTYYDPDYIHPLEGFPVINLTIDGLDSAPELSDEDFWNAQTQENSIMTSTSGYDNLNVLLSAGIIDPGTFGQPNYWEFSYRDKVIDLGTSTPNPTSSGRLASNANGYTYHDPSQNGKPGQRVFQINNTVAGVFIPTVTAWYSPNCYFLSAYGEVMGGAVQWHNSYGFLSAQNEVYATSNVVSANVFERWPTANFYVDVFDNQNCRNATASTWNGWEPDEPTTYDNGLIQTDPGRIVYGYDPLSAQFTDQSVSRTWPLSYWNWTFGDKATFLGFPLPALTAGCGGPHVTSMQLTTSNPLFHPRDSDTTIHYGMVNHLYRGPGTYLATLWVAASNTGTDSWNIVNGVTSESTMINTFTIAATREIVVLPACPESRFELISGRTVPSTYSDNDVLSGGYNFFDVGLSGVNAFKNSNSTFISGYAPNLTVVWKASSIPRSLPLSSFTIDFGDWYSEGNFRYFDTWGHPVTGRVNSPTYTNYYPNPIAGWPDWQIAGGYNQSNDLIHTYVMPGYYTVSITVATSAEQSTGACDPFSITRHVYVKEINPQACFTRSLLSASNFSVNSPISGTSPVTVYFNPSCSIAGSFPICRIDWDFGDGSDVVSISKQFSANNVFVWNTSSYGDLSDPRNYIVSHQYNRTNNLHDATYTISMSTYACNTNTVNVTSGDIGDIGIGTLGSTEGSIHLIENRMFKTTNDLLMVLEGQQNRKTFNVLLSSGF